VSEVSLALANSSAGGWNDAANPPRSLALGITTDWVIFSLFVVGLAWIPFWLGSNRMIPWGINAVIFPGLAALYELSLLTRGTPHPVPLRQIRLSVVLFTTAVAWVILQNVTWMPAGWQHPIWQLASEVLDRPIAGSISVDRSLTALALLRLMTAASVFWLALQLGRDAARARCLIWFVVAIASVYTAVGILALGFMPNGRVFADLDASKVMTSTFVNQNHYVTYAGIGFVSGPADRCSDAQSSDENPNGRFGDHSSRRQELEPS
jgi:hypothetical protein